MARIIVIFLALFFCASFVQAKIIFVGSHGGYEAYTSYWDSGWTYDPIAMANNQGTDRDTAEKVANNNGNGVDASIFFVYENSLNVLFSLISKDTANVSVGKGYIQQNYQEGDYVFLVGYSAGGKYVINLADELRKENIPVHFLGMIDPVVGFLRNITIPENVRLAEIYIQRYEIWNVFQEGFPFFFYNNSQTEYHAYVVTGPGIDHITIDNQKIVWSNLGGRMLSIAGTGPGPEIPSSSNNADVKEEAPTITSAGASDGIGLPGPGYETAAIESPDPNLPDFIVDELQLQTPSGVEQYQYETIDEIKMHAWFDNIGEANWAGDHEDMEVRFYLSKGYKEDAHDEWKHVGTDNIKKENIQISDPPKHEEEGLKLWEYHLEPGVYNIVACADRTKDQDNGDGDVPEEHKSNNCSTEAVFTVVKPNKDPYGHIDSVTSSQINGWAKDDDSYDPTDVHVYKTDIYGNNSQFVESFPADDYRVDVDQHAFFWNVPGGVKDGIAHQLFFYAINSPTGNNPQIGYTKFLSANPIGSHYPVYRFYNSTSNSHFITISEGEKDGLVFNSSVWRAERAVFRALKTQEAGSVPVYRFYSGQEHFYTAFEGEKNNLIGSTYWKYEGVRFYAFPTQISGTVPVYRLYNDSTGRHLFTASLSEKDKCLSLLGFRSEGIGWYAYPF